MTRRLFILLALSCLAITAAASAQIKPVIAHVEPAPGVADFKLLGVPPPSATDAAAGRRFSIIDGEADDNGGGVAGGDVGAPSERGERRGLGAFTRGLEVGNAEVFVFVRADEEQVLPLPARLAGIFANRRHETAQDFAEDAGHAALGRECVSVLELDDEDAPGLMRVEVGDLQYF